MSAKKSIKPVGKRAAAKKPTDAKATPASDKKNAAGSTSAKSNKRVAAPQLDDPTVLRPLVLQPRVDSESKSKVLSGMATNVRQSFEVLHARSAKRPVKLSTPAQLRRSIIPFDVLTFQNMLGSVGFRYPCAIEIVAQESVGSTTFIFDWIGRLLDIGCYVVYCECENKQMDARRIHRLLDRDPAVATIKLNAIEFTSARSLNELDNTLRQTVADLRKRCDKDPHTKGNPIFFVADPWGGLKSKGEAKGNSDWGLAANAKKETPKDTMEGSNFEHAKHASGMARWLPEFMEENNCTVVFLNKQNDKIDMQAKPTPGFLTPSPMRNDTRIGGRALKRLCAYRMTMMAKDDIRTKAGDKRVIGHNLRIMMVKSSYGPRCRTVEATVYFDAFEDSDSYMAPGFTYDERMAAWMVSNKFLGATVEKELYTCDAVGCVAVPAREFIQALNAHKEHISFIGGQLGIEGYAENPVRHIVPAAHNEVEDEDEGDLLEEEEEEPGLVPP